MSHFETTAFVNSVSLRRLPNPMHLPWRLTRLLDRRALRRKLQIKGMAAGSHELERVLVERAGEARDLFALRGVRPPRSTVFALMRRSIAADAAANDNRARPARAPAGAASLEPDALIAALR